MAAQQKNYQDFSNVLYIGAYLTLASLVGYLFRYIHFSETNIIMVYLLAVLLTARQTSGYASGILAAIIATFAFNYFFTAPYFTLAVYDPNYLITFTVFIITAIITSALTSHVKQSAIKANEKEAETKALYLLTDHLTDAENMHEIAEIAVKIISDVMQCQAGCLCFDENGLPEKKFVQQISQDEHIDREVADPEDLRHRIEGLQTDNVSGKEFHDWLIFGRDTVLGLIRIPEKRATDLTEAQTRLLRSMTESIALAMDRYRSAQQKQKYREETVQERYRGNLLRAISHDLRTPLSGIMGTAEMLMDMSNANDPRHNLAKVIYNDADWLYSLVENILSLTRLQEGKLILKKQLEAVEEVIGAAVQHIKQHAPEYEITVKIPEELLLVPMDAKLIEQVLINLLDNAVKHTAKGNEIQITVFQNSAAKEAVFSVADRGEGIAPSDLPYVFQMFYISQTKQADGQHGIGLGLSICDAIVKAHGGTIEVHNRSDGIGAEFIFSLPLEVNQDG
ncbi:MAG: DUF4118 domain-containing protein [Negativicutes bacterium]|nr:DUF4118 domain-containing protein [Negativicutes bacterium]